jgi:hypothetical protein
MTRQQEKYFLSMAGEFFVAAQLNRLKIPATVSYGNAKKADIIAFNEGRNSFVSIEVKASSKGKWVIGERVPEPSDKIWIFVHIPEIEDKSPEFYIMTQKEIHTVLKIKEIEYWNNYKNKHGKEYGDKKGVASMIKNLAVPYRDKWDIIKQALKIE